MSDAGDAEVRAGVGAPVGERVVVVTGAARGIGSSIAASFCAAGDAVVSIDVVAPDDALAGVTYLTADVADPEAVAEAFASLGRVDVLVSNAGIQRVGLLAEQPVDEWLQVLATNLHGGYFCARESIAKMSPGGAIVFLASVAAMVGLPGRSAYSAAKAGLLALTRVLAVELAPRQVRVNAVCPGFTATPLVQQGIDDGSLEVGWMLDRVPTGRLADPNEIAAAVRFLAGADASYVSGHALVVDGGWTAQGIGQAPGWLQAQAGAVR